VPIIFDTLWAGAQLCSLKSHFPSHDGLTFDAEIEAQVYLAGKESALQANFAATTFRGAAPPGSTAFKLLRVIARILFLMAGVAFVVAAAFQLRPPRNLTAAILQVAAGSIFIFLGAARPKSPRP
jgi:hypothetical protein